MRKNAGTDRNIRLDCAAGADSEDAETAVLRLDLAGLEVDICESIEFGGYNIDITVMRLPLYLPVVETNSRDS